MRISCKRKEALYILRKNTQNSGVIIKLTRESYLKLLGQQKKYYNNLFNRFHNKVKMMWNFVKAEINKQNRNNVPP